MFSSLGAVAGAAGAGTVLGAANNPAAAAAAAAQAAATNNPAAQAAAAAAAAAVNNPLTQGAANALGLQSQLDKLKSVLSLLSPKCTNPELIDPQLDDNVITEDDTHVYQPISSSMGSLGFIRIDPAAPAKYQTDNKNTLWKLILGAGVAVVFAGGLYNKLSI